jgi:hypothetical protein
MPLFLPAAGLVPSTLAGALLLARCYRLASGTNCCRHCDSASSLTAYRSIRPGVTVIDRSAARPCPSFLLLLHIPCRHPSRHPRPAALSPPPVRSWPLFTQEAPEPQTSHTPPGPKFLDLHFGFDLRPATLTQLLPSPTAAVPRIRLTGVVEAFFLTRCAFRSSTLSISCSCFCFLLHLARRLDYTSSLWPQRSLSPLSLLLATGRLL